MAVTKKVYQQTFIGDVYTGGSGKGDFKDLYIDKDDTKNGLQSDGYYYEPQDHYYIKSVISDGKTIKEIKVDGKTIQAKDIIVLKTEV